MVSLSGDIDLDLAAGFAPWDGRRVPVTLLGGYLGAGKTTAINELLARTDRPIAVLVNDVGAVNVDASLIARRHGDTIELTDGCVCCSLSHGLGEAFDQLRRRADAPDHVVIELSGVADPARVIPWAASTGFRLDGVIVLIDVDQFLDRVDDPIVGTTVQGQLASADVLLLTKLDLAPPGRVIEIRRRLQQLAPTTRILETGSAMAIAGFLNTGTRNPGGLEATPSPSLFDAHATSMVPVPVPVPLRQVEKLLDRLGPRTLRAKAVVRTPDGVNHLVQVVGRRRSITPLPHAENQDVTDLVVISAKS